jgi:predicted XRE-type DNA-binding protein
MMKRKAKSSSSRASNPAERDLESTGPIIGTSDFLADMGYVNRDEMQLKFALAHAIGQTIRKRRLTQIRVEALTGVPQSNVSRIVRGRVSGFSVSKLFEMLRSLGKDIEITLRDRRARSRTRGRLKIVLESEAA